MSCAKFQSQHSHPQVVGSFGSASDLKETPISAVLECCDLAEIRLDLLYDENGQITASDWTHLSGIPLLFTARRASEGGAGALGAEERQKLLEVALADAALVDIEVASIPEMIPLIKLLETRQIPWVASYHDFHKLPGNQELADAAKRASDAGAAIFKAAAMLSQPADLARLAEFQLSDQGIPLATMGMGPLAPVSRLLCAQAGSLLNYGFVGKTATAPGQWDSLMLKQAISRLVMLK